MKTGRTVESFDVQRALKCIEHAAKCVELPPKRIRSACFSIRCSVKSSGSHARCFDGFIVQDVNAFEVDRTTREVCLSRRELEHGASTRKLNTHEEHARMELINRRERASIRAAMKLELALAMVDERKEFHIARARAALLGYADGRRRCARSAHFLKKSERSHRCVV